MPPPPSYIDITPVPFSVLVTQAQFNGGAFGGIANEVWLRYALGAPIVLGSFTDRGGTFKADFRLYRADGTTLVGSNTSATNVAKWYYIANNEDHYIKITRHGGGASNFDFTTLVDTRPVNGDIDFSNARYIVNDDSAGFAASILNTDGSVAGFLTQIPSGEAAGQLITTGETLWFDPTGTVGLFNSLALFSGTPPYSYVLSVDVGLTSTDPAMSAANTDFYAVDRSTGEIWQITVAGVPTSMGTLSAIPSAIGVSPDGTVLYWVEGAGNASIHRYDLVNALPLTDFATIAGYDLVNDTLGVTPNGNVGEIEVQSDGGVALVWHDDSAGNWNLLYYTAAATLAHTESFNPDSLDHIAKIGADDGTVSLWLYPNNTLDRGRYGRIDLTSGLIDLDFTIAHFTQAENLILDDPTLFGPSESCTFFTLVFAAPPPECPGLILAPRQDGLPYAPPVLDPCAGTGTRGSPRIGA